MPIRPQYKQHDKEAPAADVRDGRASIAGRGGGSIAKYADKQVVFTQGDTADALFYVVSGTVKATFLSEHGKQAVIAILGAGDFFGEGCLDGEPPQNSTVTAASASEIVRLDRAAVARALDDDPVFVKQLLRFLLRRNRKLQDDLIGHLFHSSEKRLARILLTLANTQLGARSNSIAIPLSQEMLAAMVGTTRSRINQFMNKFRRLGYIDYKGRITVHGALLNHVLDGQLQDDARDCA